MSSPTQIPNDTLNRLDEFFEREFVIPKPSPAILSDPVMAQVKAYNAHDLEVFISCFAPEVEFVDSEGGLILKGHRDLFRVYSGLFKEGKIRAEVKELGTIGDHVIHHQTVVGLGKAPEAVVLIYTHIEGLIRRVRFYR